MRLTDRSLDWLLPGAVLMGVLGPLMGRIYDAFGPKVLLIPGTILIAGSLFVFATLTPNTEIWLITAVQVAMSLGLAGSFTPLFSSSLGSLKRSLYSHGSAALTKLQQVAGAAGTALLIGIYSTGLATGIANGADPATAGASGAQTAFLIGGCIAVVTVVLAFFIVKPADDQ